MGLRGYENLASWKFAMDLTERIYRATRMFPSHELYGLQAQLRRAIVSVASNLAEGSARAHRTEFMHFVSIALGSMAEVRTQIEVARRLGYFDDDTAKDLEERSLSLVKMCANLRAALRDAPHIQPKTKNQKPKTNGRMYDDEEPTHATDA